MKISNRGYKGVFTGLSVVFAALVILLSGVVTPADASGITVYKDGDKYVKMGGRMQLQYHFNNTQTSTADPSGTDKVFFRRLRPFIEGSVVKDWKGKFQWDMGKGVDGNEIAIKDAYMEYYGIKNLKILIGNVLFPFSQEALTSSKKQQFVERTLVGDHHYGTTDRNAGVHVMGSLLGKKITYFASAVMATVKPGNNDIDFGSPINRSSAANQGYMLGGRVSFHPFGFMGMSQGDLAKGSLKARVNVAAYGWQNDDDNNKNTNASGMNTTIGKADVDNVEGLEVSGALHFKGISIDTEYNRFRAETVDRTVGTTAAKRLTSGIYQDGATTLENLLVKGGYMILANRLEAVVGFERQDANNYAKKWRRTSFGANYFVKGHHIKGQVTYRIGENLNGVDGKDANEVFVQAQYVF